MTVPAWLWSCSPPAAGAAAAGLSAVGSLGVVQARDDLRFAILSPANWDQVSPVAERKRNPRMSTTPPVPWIFAIPARPNRPARAGAVRVAGVVGVAVVFFRRGLVSQSASPARAMTQSQEAASSL